MSAPMTEAEWRFVEALRAVVDIARDMGVSPGVVSGACIACACDATAEHLWLGADGAVRLSDAAVMGMQQAAKRGVAS